jgi:hypothetical protein
MEVGNLCLTRYMVGDDFSTVVFGFLPERDIREILTLDDVAFELNFAVSKLQRNQLRT